MKSPKISAVPAQIQLKTISAGVIWPLETQFHLLNPFETFVLSVL